MASSGEETGWVPGSYLQSVDAEDDEQELKEAASGEGG